MSLSNVLSRNPGCEWILATWCTDLRPVSDFRSCSPMVTVRSLALNLKTKPGRRACRRILLYNIGTRDPPERNDRRTARYVQHSLIDAMRGGEHVLLGDECAAAKELTPSGQRDRPGEFVFSRVFAVDDLRESRSPFHRLGSARFICVIYYYYNYYYSSTREVFLNYSSGRGRC